MVAGHFHCSVQQGGLLVCVKRMCMCPSHLWVKWNLLYYTVAVERVFISATVTDSMSQVTFVDPPQTHTHPQRGQVFSVLWNVLKSGKDGDMPRVDSSKVYSGTFYSIFPVRGLVPSVPVWVPSGSKDMQVNWLPCGSWTGDLGCTLYLKPWQWW